MRLSNVVVGGTAQLALYAEGAVHVVGDGGDPARPLRDTDDWLRATDDRRRTFAAAAAAIDRASPGWLPEHAATFLPAVRRPGKIFAVGRNYPSHRAELGESRTGNVPAMFMKAASSLTGHGVDIGVPARLDELDHEVELAVVIGCRALRVPAADAMSAVAGFTVANDVTDRAVQRLEAAVGASPTVAKNLPAATPLGPALVTVDEIDDAQSLPLSCEVNGERRQHDTTAAMIHPIAALISWCSMSGLEPGDVILTGTPAGVGMATGRFLRPGDVVRCEVGGVGALQNVVRAVPTPEPSATASVWRTPPWSPSTHTST